MGVIQGESADHVQYIQYYTLLIRKGMTTSTYCSHNRYLSLAGIDIEEMSGMSDIRHWAFLSDIGEFSLVGLMDQILTFESILI